MQVTAVVLDRPKEIALRNVSVAAAGPSDVVVDVAYSGISTGTEKLLWSGEMPIFPGMGYPLVPGYEAFGEVVEAGSETDLNVGDHVFVPGSSAYEDVRGLFGGAASRLVTPAARTVKLDAGVGQSGALLALAATAHHAIAAGDPPELIIGHGVLGILLARISIAMGNVAPTVWDTNEARRGDVVDYVVCSAEHDGKRDYKSVYDASGDPGIVDAVMPRIAVGGEVTLAGFYPGNLSFSFPPAFMKEMRLRVAAEWKPADLMAVKSMVESGRLSLDGLVSHQNTMAHAGAAYRTAFDDPTCLKMVIDWKEES